MVVVADLSTPHTAKKFLCHVRASAVEANARVLEAQLALEKFKAPRLLTTDQQARIVDKVRWLAGARFDLSVVTGDPEALNFMIHIADTLEKAGWSWIEFNHPGGPFMQVYDIPGKPNVGMIGAWAVLIQAHPENAAASPVP